MAWPPDGYTCKISPYTPQIPSFPEPRINGTVVPITIKNVIRHHLRIVDKCKIHFRISVVYRWIYHNRPIFGADEVVLLSVTMKQRGHYFRAAKLRKGRNQSFDSLNDRWR
jgi:hypothetical protein